MLADHRAPFDADSAAAWQVEMGVSNAEAADFVGVSLSTGSSYKAGVSIPGTVARLCRAMRGEPTMLSAHLRPRTAGNPGGAPIPVDASQAARLRWREGGRPVTADCPTLQEAVPESYGPALDDDRTAATRA